MKAHCDYEVMCKLVNDNLLPTPRRKECPYPRIDAETGCVIFKSYNAETKTVYTPGTCAKQDTGRGLFHGSFTLLKWAEDISVANGLTLAFEVIPSPPQPAKKIKPLKVAKPAKIAEPAVKPALSLREIMAAKRSSHK